MNTISLLNWMLYPLLAGVLALFLLCLSVWEFRKPPATGRVIGFAWSTFALGFGSLALMLYITTGATWHLRGDHLLNTVATMLLGLTVTCMAAGIFLLLTAVRVAGDQKAAEERVAPPSEGIWPPPPTGP